MKTQQLALSLQ